jgi:FAD/FMN-containing dehydrogenase
VAKTSLASTFGRVDQYAGFRFIQGEACASRFNDGCLLDPVTLEPLNTTCKQGVLSPHYVELQEASDAQAVFKYARDNRGTTLSIKNTGSDYYTRSSLQGSLALWTRNLRNMSYHESFVPQGCNCSSRSQPAFTFGSGVNADDAYSFAHEHGKLFVGATVNTVGTVGGWLLNGGHGALSASKGLGADRVLQFTIVTPDGEVRVANRCQNEDLFWALRGAGGGAFGVVIDSTHPAEPEGPITTVVLSFPATSENQRPFVSVLAEHMREWALAGWSATSNANFSLLVSGSASAEEAEELLSPAIAYALSQDGGVANVVAYKSFFEFYVDNMNSTFATPAAISFGLATTTRLVPESHFVDEAARELMVDAIMETTAAGVPTSFLATSPLLYGRSHPNPGTPLHPAWYKSVWLVASAAVWTATTPIAERREIVHRVQNATEKWKALVPDGCAYVNEADPWDDDWAESFWGDNYGKLLDIKAQVDPDGLLHCRHCVGWTTSLQGYGCMQDLAD